MQTEMAALPQLIRKGVVFRMRVDAQERECLVSKDALEMLSGLKDTNPDPLEVFYAFQPFISEIAGRRLRDCRDDPLVLGPDSFADPAAGYKDGVSISGSGEM